MDLENVLYLDLKDGQVIIQLLPEVAPNHVARIKELVRAGFYNGLKFHRVINSFMAQTGCPNSKDGGNYQLAGTGGSGKNIKAEFNKINHVRGICSMARAQHPDSADSQFFICLADSLFLDSQYSVWGKVIQGMEFVDNIKKGDPVQNGTVSSPDSIIKMTVAADVA